MAPPADDLLRGASPPVSAAGSGWYRPRFWPPAGAALVRRLARRLVAELWTCMVAFGSGMSGMAVPSDDPVVEGPDVPGELSGREGVGSGGPAAGHPERLCPEMPLTRLERRLARELSRHHPIRRSLTRRR
ncbi:hypothetical protein MXD61_03775 [Frankia sp. AgPm24]|uniref:DUF6059 family protein n=1 Tax=Frankia sp. AgPm24 TaxID=631128 RepID=UPI00200D3351|nr:DUF6059 family protein [Frankia sp. AgPm24]MCK9921033.1 hypothetical protein [Frankia sp. AgPm24]